MILYNNNLIEADEIGIKYNDRGYQFGDGVYEVIRVYNKEPFLINGVNFIIPSPYRARSLKYKKRSTSPNLV